MSDESSPKKPKTISVELVGQSGSGKSTLAKSLIEKLRQSNYTCPSLLEIDRLRALAGMFSQEAAPLNRRQRARYLLGAALRHPWLAVCVLLHLGEELLFPKSAAFGKRLIKISTLIETVERAADEDIIVWDEGVVSTGLFHAASVEKGEIIEGIFHGLGNRFYICIHLDVRSVLERGKHRYPRRVTSMRPRRAIARLRKKDRVIAVVIEHLRTTYPSRVLVLDGTTQPNENANTAFEFIAAKLQGAEDQRNCTR